MAEGARLRIGELSKRVGVSPELLRAWEVRYGLVAPERTAGGLRLYSEQDEQRVRLMCEQIAAGLSAAEAARVATQREDPTAAAGAAALAEIEALLESSLERLDEPLAQEALDRLFRTFSVEGALSRVVLPFMYRLGERWAMAERSVAQEHFASNVIGGRLRTLARGWGEGRGPRAILACPPGERHELGLVCFGLTLREHGWRVTYLGAETPLEDVEELLEELAPAIVALAAVTPEPLNDARREIRRLAKKVRVGIGGAGASEALARRLHAEFLGGDATGAAARLAP